MPDANVNGSTHFPRYNGGRSRPQQVNGNGTLEEKMGAMSVAEVGNTACTVHKA